MSAPAFLYLVKEKIAEVQSILEDPKQISSYEDYKYHLGRMHAFRECLEIWKEN